MSSERKRFKREQNALENLPNELFVEIFGYLNGVDAVYAFYPLNIRFLCLLNQYVNNFDFTSVSKTKFKFITQVHSMNQWRSLTISNDDQTPGQINFFTESFPFDQYIPQLESLTALSMVPEQVPAFLSQVESLNNLVSLSIGHICGLTISSIQLPLLKRLTLKTCKNTAWLMNLHNLENLQYTIEYNCSHVKNLTIPKQLKQLRVFYEEGRDGADLRQLLQQMSQLSKLAICDNARYSPLPNGRIWEDLIVSSLPLLNQFQFFFAFDHLLSPSGDITQSIASFSTNFYLHEKLCFIRCDRDPINPFTGALYSLPFAFSRMLINTRSFETSLSTLPISNLDETKSYYYTKVHTIVFNQECKAPHVGFLSFNILHLILKANLPESWIYLLTNLRHLQIGTDVTMSSYDFMHLLNHAPNLQSLTIPIFRLKLLTDNFKNENVCFQLSQRIQTLTISHHYLDTPNLGIVSVRLLSALVRVFSMKCQHLSLALVAHPNTVRPMLRRMRELRSLHIYWPYMRRYTYDPIACWLDQQSTDLTAIDYVHTNDKNHFFIWFGNRI